uniref:Uncharacterized protein n=1 Tax=Globisporangium ultimum (strain ATCC 200006 / CBS 805.95 / DAOM BR144) TaxID=431595 RepID=K3WTF3_GLOUD
MTTKESVAHAAEIAHAPVPHAVLLHEGLLTPPQRRERLEFETAFHHARRALQRADNNERRRQQLIVSRHLTCDVTGTAQVAPNEPSRVRGEPFKPDLLSHDMQVRDQHKYREFARKADAMNPRLNHHERIFNETPVEWNPQRAQHLRNEGEGGRSFDIVNGGVITYLPPTIAEKTYVRQAHPSVIVHPYVR